MEGNSYKTDKSNSTRANAKTVVIQKDTQSMGITQRSIQELWNQVEHKRNHEGKHITIQVSFLQIYNEKVFDLLNLSHLSKPSSDNNGLWIWWDRKNQFMVENLFVYQCKSQDEILDLFNFGIKNKVVASHNLN